MTRGHATYRPVVGLTMGDPSGIGPEVCLRALLSPGTWEVSLPLLVGNFDVFEFYRKKYRFDLTIFQTAAVPVTWERNVVPVIGPDAGGSFRVRPGERGKYAATLAAESLVRAVGLWNEGSIDAIVTGPLTKFGLREAGYPFPGQTEMLASLTGEKNVMMVMISGDLRVGLLTIHIPLRKVPGALTARSLTRILRLFAGSLRRDFGITRPRIAVLGLNPHAGEDGLIGTEEQRILIPVMKKLKTEAMTLSGPFPADGFFGYGRQTPYDGVLAMYHDQGLIPLKMSGNGGSVNYSAGLSLVRTSPGHGTAYDIAGKGIAEAGSMVEAVKIAASVTHSRRSSDAPAGRT